MPRTAHGSRRPCAAPCRPCSGRKLRRRSATLCGRRGRQAALLRLAVRRLLPSALPAPVSFCQSGASLLRSQAPPSIGYALRPSRSPRPAALPCRPATVASSAVDRLRFAAVVSGKLQLLNVHKIAVLVGNVDLDVRCVVVDQSDRIPGQC